MTARPGWISLEGQMHQKHFKKHSGLQTLLFIDQCICMGFSYLSPVFIFCNLWTPCNPEQYVCFRSVFMLCRPAAPKAWECWELQRHPGRCRAPRQPQLQLQSFHGIGDRPSPGWDMGPTWAQLGRAQGWAGLWGAGDRPCCGLTRQRLMAPRPVQAVLWGLAISLHSLPAEMIPDRFFFYFFFYSHLWLNPLLDLFLWTEVICDTVHPHFLSS